MITGCLCPLHPQTLMFLKTCPHFRLLSSNTETQTRRRRWQAWERNNHSFFPFSLSTASYTGQQNAATELLWVQDSPGSPQGRKE